MLRSKTIKLSGFVTDKKATKTRKFSFLRKLGVPSYLH